MGSALETLCGQAYGAGQLRMLGVYMQRSWVILFTTACLLVPLYVFSPPILELFGEATDISRSAGHYSLSNLYIHSPHIFKAILKIIFISSTFSEFNTSVNFYLNFKRISSVAQYGCASSLPPYFIIKCSSFFLWLKLIVLFLF